MLIAIFRTNLTSAVTSTPITINWNLQDLDISKNGNTLRTLLCLEANKAAAPSNPTPSVVLNNPSKFYGQYLQFSGTVESFRAYSPQNNLETILIGNSSEMVMKTNDGTTRIDCFLIGSNVALTPRSSVTVYGYSPGIRYAQNAQGRVISELALIGHCRILSAPNTSPEATFPVSPDSNSSITPNPT